MLVALTNMALAYASSSGRSMSPSRRGSFRLGGILPPHFLLFPASLAASIAFSILARVFLSLFGTMQETEYFSSLPLMLLGSQMLAKEIRHGMITLVADGVLSTSKTCA